MRFLAWLVGDEMLSPRTAATYFGQVQGWHAKEHGIKLAAGIKLSRLPAIRKRMRHTTMYRRNTWDIAFGDCDQGFLFHMFYLHPPRTGGGPIGRDFAPVPLHLDCRNWSPGSTPHVGWECPHTARHYWGPKKPWELEKDNRGRVAHYLAHTNYSNTDGSMCAARFADYARILPRVEPSAKPPSKNNGKLQRVR